MVQHRRLILLLGDIVALALAFSTMVLLRFHGGLEGSTIALQAKLFALLFVIWLVVFFIFDLYNIRRVNPNPRNIGLLIASTALNVLLGVLFFYLSPETSVSPKTNLLIVAGLAFVFLFLWRRLFYHLFTVRFNRSIVLIGSSPLIEHLVTELRAHPQLGTVVARFDAIPQALFEERADIIIAEHVNPRELLAFARTLDAEVLSLSDAYETLFGKIPLELMTHDKALSYMSQHHTGGLYFVYRSIEILFAVVVLIISSPFMLMAILARLIEDGTPIFYKQRRVGKDGKLFFIYKLRSMHKDAEKAGAQWATVADSRITRLGRILRTTHLDEVPQMLNIILGDIALVGPRPERPEFVSDLETSVPYYFLRHAIRPGFTGWAQIKFRYARTADDSKQKFEYDLYYIKNGSPLLDMGIVIKTIQIIFTH